MLRIPSYLQLNIYGIYHFRIRLTRPLIEQLGRTEFNRSLRTSSKRKAIHLAQGIKFKLDTVFRIIQDKKMNWSESKKLLDKIYKDTLDKFNDEIEEEGPWGDTEGRFGYEDAYVEMEALAFHDLKIYGEQKYDDIDFKTQEIVERDFTGHMSSVLAIREYANKIIKKYGLKFTEETYERFCTQVAQMLIKLHMDRWEIIDKMREKSAEHLYTEVIIDDSTIDTTQQSDNTTHSIPLVDVFNKFYQEKTVGEGSWSENTASQRVETFNRIHEILEHLLGYNKIDINYINAQHATQLKGIIAQLPKHLKKRYPKLSIKEVLAVNNTDTIDARTQNNYLGLMSSIFEYAQKHHYVSDNPFKDLLIKVSKKKRKRHEYKKFMDDDLTKLFSTSLFKDKKTKLPWQFWVPVIALYTGARIEEICQLHIHDIKDINGTYVISIQEAGGNKSIKTEAGTRNVPIHSKLIEIGLLDYVEMLKAKGEMRLFPMLKAIKKKFSPYVSKWFNEDSNRKISYKTKCGINEKGKVFHSFRKTFVNNLKQKGIGEAMVASIVGHEKNTMTYGVYGDPYNLGLIKEVVEKIDYTDANLPWDVNPDYSKIKFPWK